MAFVDTGRWRWTTTGFGSFWPLACSPRLALLRLRWCVMLVAGGANTAGAGVNVRWRAMGRSSVTTNWIVACHGVSVGAVPVGRPFHVTALRFRHERIAGTI